MQNNTHYMQEETIDLKELYLILKKRKKFIWIVTFLFTLLSLAYVFLTKPVYEVKAVVELAQIDRKPVHPTGTLKQKINTIFEVGVKNKKIELPIVTSVEIPKKTTNILVIKAQGYDNASAKEKLLEAISYIATEQNKELTSYTDIQKKRLFLTEEDIVNTAQFIKNTERTLSNYENKLLNISKQDAALAGIYAIEISRTQTELNIAANKVYSLKNQKNDIEFSLTPQKLQKTALIGNVAVLEKPIKPKKILIVLVAFISGLMLSIFLAFFLEFIGNMRKEEIH